jgi:hypothetical protein
MSASKVYIPQIVEVYSESNNRHTPLFDFSDAERFGHLVAVLEPSDNPSFLALLTTKIRKALVPFTINDYLVAVGDPAIIGICAGIILRRQKKLKMLRWDRRLKMYIELELNP